MGGPAGGGGGLAALTGAGTAGVADGAAGAAAAGDAVMNPELTYDNAMLNSSIERSYAGIGAIVM